jgi:DNA-binding MarR family transcriptional regulator
MAAKKHLDTKQTDSLLKAMLVFSRTVDQVLETRAVQAAAEPLSKSKVQILRLLGQRGGQTATHIARFLGVSKPAVTQIVDALVQRNGLVVRTRSKRDRRGVEVKLTAKGRRVIQKVRVEQRHLVRSTMRQSSRAGTGRWIELLEEISGTLARADRAFQDYCLQCTSHSDGSCVLTGGDGDCLFLQHQGAGAKNRKRASASTSRPKR